MRFSGFWGRLLCAALLAPTVSAQTPQSYSDGNRGEVVLPQGDLSFADTVLAFEIGDAAPTASARNPEAALGPPTYVGNNNDGSFTTLGCNGMLDVQFTDNALIDLEGPDLYVFEVGPDVEGTQLAISQDGITWIDVGGIAGGRSEVDIASVATPGASYRFVRLVDDGEDCRGRFPGADIDAIAAIGSATRFVLDGSVLFSVGSAVLKPDAQAALKDLANEIAQAGITAFEITGHTDSDGSAEYNLELSNARATAVRDYLLSSPALADATATARGAGESEPVSDNTTDAGKAANRRVEIIATSGQ